MAKPESWFGSRALLCPHIRWVSGATLPLHRRAGPFEVWWKVRNRGEEAARLNQLRGEIRRGGPGSVVHREQTQYRGRHYVEVYIVKDGRVVATDRMTS